MKEANKQTQKTPLFKNKWGDGGIGSRNLWSIDEGHTVGSIVWLDDDEIVRKKY